MNYSKSFEIFFAKYPCSLLKPQEMIFEDEINNYQSLQKSNVLFNAFSTFGKDDSYNYRKISSKYF